jgi:DNA-binding NarL/FixJ family response regulator
MNGNGGKAKSRGRKGPRVRVLLVDDSEEFLNSATGFLSMDPEVEVIGRARSGAEAIEQTLLLRPDLILMDAAMPGMSGFDATKEIKSLSDPPFVIIVTMHDNAEYQALAKSARADDFVGKPDFGDTVMPLIEKLFSGRWEPGSRWL